MSCSMLRWVLVFSLAVGTVDANGGTGLAKPAARAFDDLIEWLTRTAPRAFKRTDDAADVLSQTARRMRASGDTISDRVVDLLKRNYDTLPLAIFRDDALLRFASRSDEVADATFAVAKRFPVERLGSRLESLADGCPQSCNKVLRALSGPMAEEHSQLLLRGVAGRELSNAQVQSVVKALQNSTDGQSAGEFFELLCRAQINGGTMKPKISLQPGTRLVDGRYNAIHGIDGVGVADDGAPLVLEFTVDESKNLAKTGQLRPDHVMDRWNRLLKAPDGLDRLRSAGVAEKYLAPIDEATAATFHRKLVAHNNECLTDSNRVAAGLGMDDLLVLGK